jgi:hypothetical protein
VGKPERKIALGTPRSRYEDNIKINVRHNEVIKTRLIWLRIGKSGGLL